MPISEEELRYLISFIVLLLLSKKTYFRSKIYLFLYNVSSCTLLISIVNGFKQTMLFHSIVLINIAVLWLFTAKVQKYPQIGLFMNITFNLWFQYTMLDFSEGDPMQNIVGILFMFTMRATMLFDEFNGSFCDAFNYLYFVPSILTGPHPSFKEFLAGRKLNTPIKTDKVAAERENQKNSKEVFEGDEKNYSLLVSREDRQIKFEKYMRISLISLVCILISNFFNFNQELLKSKSILMKMFFSHLQNIKVRMPFYFGWYWTSSCLAMHGHNIINVLVWETETCDSLAEVCRTWNSVTSKFFKKYVFKPVVEITRKKFLAATACFAISSLMHSYSLADLIFFVGGGLATYFFERAHKILPLFRSSIFIRQLSCFIFFDFIVYIRIGPYLRNGLKYWENMQFCGLKYYLLLQTLLRCYFIIKSRQK
ncbi:hypothetical protein NUSPORA_01006 [Nucleospora cyclopteri]